MTIHRSKDQKVFPHDIDSWFSRTANETYSNTVIPLDDKLVHYCLQQGMKSGCRVRASPTILVVVIIGNAIKAVCMFCTFQDKTLSLTTLGDAIESFLKVEDIHTQGFCNLTREHVRTSSWRTSSYTKTWRRKLFRNIHSVSLLQWLASNIWFVDKSSEPNTNANCKQLRHSNCNLWYSDKARIDYD